MITVPLWLLAALIGAVGLLALALAARVHGGHAAAQRYLDRLLVNETSHTLPSHVDPSRTHEWRG